MKYERNAKKTYPLILAEAFRKKWFAKITLGAFTHNIINLTIEKLEFEVVAEENLFHKLNVELEAQQKIELR